MNATNFLSLVRPDSILAVYPQNERKVARFWSFSPENPGSKIRDRGIENEFRHRMLWKFQNTLDAPFC
jgi:hypothetical protein